MQKNHLLKVSSIIMTVSASLSILLFIAMLFLFGYLNSAVASTSYTEVGTSALIWNFVSSFLVDLLLIVFLALMCAVVRLIAGIKGTKSADDPQKGASCVKWGITMLVMNAVYTAVALIILIVTYAEITSLVHTSGGSFNLTSTVTSFASMNVLPVLYLIGALKAKKALNDPNYFYNTQPPYNNPPQYTNPSYQQPYNAPQYQTPQYQAPQQPTPHFNQPRNASMDDVNIPPRQ